MTLRPGFVIVCLFVASCGELAPPSRDPSASAQTTPAPAPPPRPLFDDVATATGLVFVHATGATGRRYLPEIMGSGVGVFDVDNDGDLDVFAVQGGTLDATGDRSTAAHRLFRNRLAEDGELAFDDVTEAAGIATDGYGMGVATGDIDNDGDVDLLITQVGDNRLFVNAGDGTFVPGTLPPVEPRWTTSASFADLDGDGLLDLAWTNYVAFSTALEKDCRGAGGEPDYCHPTAYRAQADRVLKNLGGGRFEDVTATSGIGTAYGPGLGILAADFDADGDPDVFVANDGDANQLWRNDGAFRLTDTGLMSGTAFNADGKAEASMGVAAGDIDGDGDLDLVMTHLVKETNTLYLNDGRGNFFDATLTSGLAQSSLPFTGFGTAWIDVDNDGRLDLYVANGAVARQRQSTNPLYPYDQRDQLFLATGSARFVEVSADAAPALRASTVSRGVAAGDIDNDGDVDLVVSDNNGRLRLLLNRVGQDAHWLSVRLRGTTSNRDAIGARVALIRPDGSRAWRHVHRDGSYLSAHDVRVHFGLGSNPDVDAVEVSWPSGLAERFPVDGVNREIELVEGTATPD